MSKEQILAFLESHKEEMLSDIGDLIRINSEKMPPAPGMPYGEGPAKALELALTKAAGYGFSVKNYDNYVGCVDFNEKEKQLDILAHLDVVPVEPSAWTVTAPFAPLIKDGRLYGRGSSDDKGPAMAALYAMRAVKELGIPLKKNVRLILGCDEECGSSDIEYYYSKEQEAPMTFSPDAEFPVINLEKGHYVAQFSASWERETAGARVVRMSSGTKFNVIPGDCHVELAGIDRGQLTGMLAKAEKLLLDVAVTEEKDTICLTVTGKSGHAASPEKANNALTGTLALLLELPLSERASSKALRGLSELFPHGDYAGAAAGVAMEDEISGALTISLNMLTLTEEGLTADFDSRYPICGNRENIADVLTAKGREKGLTLSDSPMSAPHYVPSDTPFVRTLLKCYEMYKGRPGRCMAIGGGTYVHNLKNGVAFGPVELDTETNLHGNDESIPIDDLIISAAIYAQSIIELCGQD